MSKQPIIVLEGPRWVEISSPVELSNDGVLDASGKFVSWDRIVSGEVGTDQARFDELHSKWHSCLFRLRSRFKANDWDGVVESCLGFTQDEMLTISDSAQRFVTGASCVANIELGNRNDAVLDFLRVKSFVKNEVFQESSLIQLLPSWLLDNRTYVAPKALPIFFYERSAESLLGEIEALTQEQFFCLPRFIVAH
ncbi:MAG: hypothetical protein R3C03_05465 [Pirellulaceae bacterium]